MYLYMTREKSGEPSYRLIAQDHLQIGTEAVIEAADSIGSRIPP